MKVAHQATRRRTFTLQLIDRPEPHQHLCLQCDAFEECSNPECATWDTVDVCDRCQGWDDRYPCPDCGESTRPAQGIKDAERWRTCDTCLAAGKPQQKLASACRAAVMLFR